MAVLLQALVDLAAKDVACDVLQVERDEAREDAMRWIMSDDHTDPFAFVTLCHLFNYEPSAFRAAVLRRLDRGDLRLPHVSDLFDLRPPVAEDEERAA